MPTEQYAEMLWETPTHEEIIGITKGHVEAMETMDIDDVWVQAGMHHVMLDRISTQFYAGHGLQGVSSM